MTSGEAFPALQDCFQSMEGAVTKVGIWRACTASAGRVQELNPSSIFNAGRRVAQPSAPPRWGCPPFFARFSFREGWVAVCSHNGTRPSRRAGRTPLKAASEPPCSAQDDIFRIIAKKKALHCGRASLSTNRGYRNIPSRYVNQLGAGADVCTLISGGVAQRLGTADIRTIPTVSNSRTFFILQFSLLELGPGERDYSTPRGRIVKRKLPGSAFTGL